MFLIFAILLAQFNKFTSVVLVLSAVMLPTIGALLGLMIMGQPFGVVMTGIGIIANAGVIVNNNIVLIDTYDRLRREGQSAYDAIMETCRARAPGGADGGHSHSRRVAGRLRHQPRFHRPRNHTWRAGGADGHRQPGRKARRLAGTRVAWPNAHSGRRKASAPFLRIRPIFSRPKP
jgi:predicted membrane metal-binding protein